MVCSGRLFAAILLALAATGLGGCGAGLITGVAASSGGNRSEPTKPELSVSPFLPLVPAENSVRSVLVTNSQLTGSATLEVRLAAMTTVVSQPNPLASAQGSSTQITFVLDTDDIVAEVAQVAPPTAADVPATLSVWADGRLVADAAITLARQPTASLTEVGIGEPLFLSPLGQRVAIAVEGLRSTAIADLEVLITTEDPNGIAVNGEVPTITRIATGIQFEPTTLPVPVLSAIVPGSTFPVAATIVVRDFEAGESTPIENAYYEPELALILPSQGPTTGGTLLTLIGTALVPYDFSAGPGPAPLDFDAVHLSFCKGGPVTGRVTQLAPADFRILESGPDRLVFTMPPSPDGRPGEVEIVLEVELGAVMAQARQVFLFANPDPIFGPRGVVFNQLPIAIAPIRLDNAPNMGDAPDIAVLTNQGGVAFLQLLLAQQNGMFQPFAAPRQIADNEVAAERGPSAIVAGDFNDDDIPDVFIVNEGAATAVHHLVLGQARPAPPFGAVYRVPAAPGSRSARVADFDGNGVPDLLFVPGPNAPAMQRPQVMLARPQAGQPAFDAPIDLVVRDFDYEAVEVDDLDGDGALDVAVVSGSELKLDVAFGVVGGNGTFDSGLPFDITLLDYTPDAASPAVGLHACRDGPRQSLGLVLAGVLDSTVTEPTVAVLSQPSARVFNETPPTAALTPLPPPILGEPIGRSLAADLDDVAPIELVIAFADDPARIALGLLQLELDVVPGAQPPVNAFNTLTGLIEGIIIEGGEDPRQIRALAFDTAFPANLPEDEAKAVFIVHEVDIDGGVERRLSTRLVAVPAPGEPQLLPPDAGGRMDFPIQRVIGGSFHESSVDGALDLALVRTDPSDQIVLIENDGFGGFTGFSNRIEYPGLLPGSLVRMPAPVGPIDGLVFCGRDSRIGYWLHDGIAPEPCATSTCAPAQLIDDLSPALRNAISGPLSTIDLDDGTRTTVADVDGDGYLDLVVLLSFAVMSPGEGDARIALLRGKASAAPGELPFVVPTTLTPVHGNATSFALGNFAGSTVPGPDPLELAVAVPTGSGGAVPDGEHVRFFRYVRGIDPTGADDHFAPSAVPGGPQVLLAGSVPTLVVASDFDRDGLVDLLVACRGDNRLRLFRNTSAPQASGQVDVNAFVEASSSNQMDIGRPTLLQLSDINGDGNLDAVVFVEQTMMSGVRRTLIGTYLSSGSGQFEGPRPVSPTRSGTIAFDATLSGDLGDWNRDGVPDLFLGWSLPFTPLEVNLRVLFGGTR